MLNTFLNSTQGMIDKLQILKGKTKKRALQKTK